MINSLQWDRNQRQKGNFDEITQLIIMENLLQSICHLHFNYRIKLGDSEAKIWILILSISICGRETNYSYSSLSRSTSSEISLAIIACFFFYMFVGMLKWDNVKCTCLNHMSTITIVVTISHVSNSGYCYMYYCQALLQNKMKSLMLFLHHTQAILLAAP